MKITIKQRYKFMSKALREDTYQSEFSESIPCHACLKPTKSLMVIDDHEGLISEERPKKVAIWPHDCMAIALYLCTDCGEITAKWNQG